MVLTAALLGVDVVLVGSLLYERGPVIPGLVAPGWIVSRREPPAGRFFLLPAAVAFEGSSVTLPELPPICINSHVKRPCASRFSTFWYFWVGVANVTSGTLSVEPVLEAITGLVSLAGAGVR